MRLIDADKLIFEGQKYNKSQMKAILDFMDAQPTIYDIDKVVEELKQEIEWVDQWGKRYCSQQKAIEIVKQGLKSQDSME